MEEEPHLMGQAPKSKGLTCLCGQQVLAWLQGGEWGKPGILGERPACKEGRRDREGRGKRRPEDRVRGCDGHPGSPEGGRSQGTVSIQEGAGCSGQCLRGCGREMA